MLAVVQLAVFRKERKNRLVVFWFSGLLFLYLFFTMSFTEYKPMPLRFTWYLFPLFLPAMILASKIFSGLKKGWMIVLLSVYISAALYMTGQFKGYFDTDNIAEFEELLKSDAGRVIYTDHFTKYSIDLIDGFKEPGRTFRLSGKEEISVPEGAYIVLHTGHVSEINKQGFDYPGEEHFRKKGFSELKRFGSFIIYEKKLN
jgi:hypothetical protein